VPSANQCTAVDDVGNVVTFDPTSSGTATRTEVDPLQPFVAVACRSASQCTAVDGNQGAELTFDPFDPTSPAFPTETVIDSAEDGVAAMACPSVSQCTAVDQSGREVTFDPTAPGNPIPIPVDNANQFQTGVACPSVSQCTAVDQA
jgi:hypothetical protein